MRLNLNCPLVFVPGYLVLNWIETEDPTTDNTGSDGLEGEPAHIKSRGQNITVEMNE